MSDKKTAAHLSRRLILGSGLGLLSSPIAFARTRPLLNLPASVVFLRMNEDGALPPTPHDREMWSQFSMNLGALISRIEPIPHNNLLPGGELETGSGKGSAILSARMSAQSQGYDYLIVYGVVSRSESVQYKTKRTLNPVSKFSRTFRSKLPLWHWETTEEPYTETRANHLDMVGEAHLLDLNGGAPVASSWAELPKRSRLEKLTTKDTRVTDIIQSLADDLQRKIQDLSIQNFRDQRSISERF